MKTLEELRTKLAALITEWRGLTKAADEGNRDLTDEENTRCTAIGAEVDAIKLDMRKLEASAELRARMEAEGKELDKVVNPLRTIGDRSTKTDQWDSLGAFVRDACLNPDSNVMREYREQTMGTGKAGGFAIPEQFRPTLLDVAPQTAIVRPRAQVLPAGEPPDAKLSMPSLDQTSAQNIYGGAVVTHTGEGVTMTETDLKLREISWEPKEMTAYIVATNKVLVNWSGASALLESQLRKAMAGSEDYDFLRGDGINKALGITNCAAAILYGRAGANAISWADVYGMFSRLKMGGSPVWLASQTIIPQLAAMVDAGSHAVWISGSGIGTGAAQNLPGTLMGIPIVFAERLPALGTKGDLILADLSYYVIKDGSGPFVSWTEHLWWASNKSGVKIVWNVDARPWLTEPIGLEGATTSTVSPFVVLN
jgi:HK97 family phage major capsid protein